MGYVVETTGRVLLPLEREGAAPGALKTAMAARQGWFDPDDADWPVTSLADLASFVAASDTRDVDRLVLDTEEEGDPKWSEQATAFYAEQANWGSRGLVVFSGEDGTGWSYVYDEGRLTQSGINGWDGSAEPFGDPVEVELPAEKPRQRAGFRRGGRGATAPWPCGAARRSLSSETGSASARRALDRHAPTPRP